MHDMSNAYSQFADRRKATVLSFPRSGSNWVCYCINQITGLVVLGSYDEIEGPTVDYINLPTVIYKTHATHSFWTLFPNPGEGLFLIIRDPKACITRHGGQAVTVVTLKLLRSFLHDECKTTKPDYLNILRVYDNYDGPKYHVYYEDFIRDPAACMPGIMEWFEQFGGRNNPEDLEGFMANFEVNREESLRRYRMHNATVTSGDPNTLNYYVDSGEVSEEVCRQMQDHIKNAEADLYERYLTRYEI